MSTVYTMVCRKGDPKGSTLDMGYMLLGADGSQVGVSGRDLYNKLKSHQIEVVNLSIKGNEIISTNGDIKKYPMQVIDAKGERWENGNVGVIVGRIETNGKLSGYRMFCSGTIVDPCSVADAMRIYNQNGIANGKVRHTSEGDIISAIGGTFPLYEFKQEKVAEKKVEETGKDKLSILFITVATDGKTSVAYAGVLVTNSYVGQSQSYQRICSKANDRVMDGIKKLNKAYGITDYNYDSLKQKNVNDKAFYTVVDVEYLKKMIKSFASNFYDDNDYAQIFTDGVGTALSVMNYSEDGYDDVKLSVSGVMANLKKEEDAEEVRKAKAVIMKHEDVLWVVKAMGNN